MQERKNVFEILEKAKDYFEKDNSSELKILSNQTNNTASRTHDPDNIALAVIVYSLGKILEREKYKEHKQWSRFSKNISLYLVQAIKAVKNNNNHYLSKSLELIRKEINSFSEKFRQYIQDVFRKASINKASKIYEHGISMEKTAKLLGITMFEMADYTGQKDIENLDKKDISVKFRIKLAMDMFK